MGFMLVDAFFSLLSLSFLQLSDFGMAVSLGTSASVNIPDGAVPVKWMAPESINFRSVGADLLQSIL